MEPGVSLEERQLSLVYFIPVAADSVFQLLTSTVSIWLFTCKCCSTCDVETESEGWLFVVSHGCGAVRHHWFLIRPVLSLSAGCCGNTRPAMLHPHVKRNQPVSRLVCQFIFQPSPPTLCCFSRTPAICWVSDGRWLTACTTWWNLSWSFDSNVETVETTFEPTDLFFWYRCYMFFCVSDSTHPVVIPWYVHSQ